MRPPSMAKMTSALRMVESRWAIAIVVRRCISAPRAHWTTRSDSVSSANVASSRIKIKGYSRITRAIGSRWRSPPEKR
jgi:hypothetical protein